MKRWLTAVGLIGFLLMPGTGQAAEVRGGEDAVTVPREQIVNDDLYLAGGTATVTGTVNGDLVVFGGTVTVEGTVNGSVWVAGGTVTVTGTVTHSVRVAGGEVFVRGKVGGDVLFVGGDLRVEAGSEIGRDVGAAGGTVAVEGTVGRSLKLAADHATVRGSIGGNITGTAEGLSLTETARVAGGIRFRGPEEPSRATGAQVGGTIDYSKVSEEEETVWGKIAGQLYWFVAAMLLLLALMLYARRAVLRAAAVLAERPGASFLVGLAFLVLTPVIGLIFFVTVFGIPLAAVLFAAYVVILYLAKLFVAVAIGQSVLRRSDDRFITAFGAGTLGLLLFYFLGALPGIGWAVNLLAVVFGVGAQLLLIREVYDANRKKYGV